MPTPQSPLQRFTVIVSNGRQWQCHEVHERDEEKAARLMLRLVNNRHLLAGERQECAVAGVDHGGRYTAARVRGTHEPRAGARRGDVRFMDAGWEEC